MFAALGDLTGCHVLDLYAGSGALGVEALSRGARHAVFVERARPSRVVLEANLSDLGLGKWSEVLGMDALRALPLLAHRGLRFDLILLDPPYGAAALEPALASLRRLGLVAPGGVVVAERAKRNPLGELAGWSAERERTYGQTVVIQLRPDPANGTPGGTTEAVAKHHEH